MLFQTNEALARVDPADFVYQHLYIGLSAQDRSQRPENLVGRKQTGRHLVEHGTKEMVVALVDQRHADGSAG